MTERCRVVGAAARRKMDQVQPKVEARAAAFKNDLFEPLLITTDQLEKGAHAKESCEKLTAACHHFFLVQAVLGFLQFALSLFRGTAGVELLSRTLLRIVLPRLEEAVAELADFSTRELRPLRCAPLMRRPALFVHARDDKLLGPHHAEALVVSKPSAYPRRHVIHLQSSSLRHGFRPCEAAFKGCLSPAP